MPHQQDASDETGISVPEGRESQAERPRERKANAALDLRLAGYSYEEIATVLGYPNGKAAAVAFERAREKHLQEDPDAQAKMRDLAGRRLERLLRAVWEKAIKKNDPEQMAAQQRALAIIDRHAKLYGLDAPTQHVISTPTVNEIDQWLADVRKARGEVYEEGDIFGNTIEGEVVSDDEDPPKELGA